MLEQTIKMFMNIKTSFIGIRNHESKKSGKVANFTVNIGTDYKLAQQRDLEMLNKIYFGDMSLNETEEIALMELIIALEKNISDNKDEHSNQSRGQSEAYTKICNGVRVHNETGNIHIFGMKVQEKILKEGTYPKVNKRPKTVAKDKFRKDMISQKFRTFIVNDIARIAILGQVIDPNDPLWFEAKEGKKVEKE